MPDSEVLKKAKARDLLKIICLTKKLLKSYKMLVPTVKAFLGRPPRKMKDPRIDEKIPKPNKDPLFLYLFFLSCLVNF